MEDFFDPDTAGSEDEGQPISDQVQAMEQRVQELQNLLLKALPYVDQTWFDATASPVGRVLLSAFIRKELGLPER